MARVVYRQPASRQSGSGSTSTALRPFVARALAASHRIIVTGHADATGIAEVNRQVSLRRARAVASCLVSLGVPVDLVSVRGAGSDQPIASNDTLEGRRLNRRVDVQLVPVRPARRTKAPSGLMEYSSW
jgi:outer membrane protein OmpA-like peptidoglycan-associated protein